MNIVATAIVGTMVVAVATATAALLVPRPARSAVVGAGTALCGAAGMAAGIAALAGQVWSAAVAGLLPLAGVVLTVDTLSGVFTVSTTPASGNSPTTAADQP